MNEKHPQRAIPEHNDLLNLTINNLPIGVILFDPKGNVLFSNTQGAQYLGYNSTEDLISIKDLDSMRKHLLETFIIKNESGELYTADKSPVMIAINEKRNNQYIAHFINKKNGQESWAIARANPIMSESNEVALVVYSLTDITEQKNLQQRNDRFMSMASHELKTPVTTIKTLVQLLELQYKNGNDQTLVEYLSTIGEQIEQLTKLVTDLLDVSKIKAEKFKVEEKIFDFDALVSSTIKSCQLLSPQHSIHLKGDTNVQLCGDQNGISRVFINLITNAIKYSPQGNDIVVRTSETNGNVLVAIEDHGIGVAKEHQRKIFERYYQVGNDNGQSFSGLGIGLYIATAIVAEHGGRMWVESEGVGKGAVFYFTLPICAAKSA